MRHNYKTLAAVAFALSYFIAWCAPSAAQSQQTAPRTLSYQGVLQTTGTGTKAAGPRILTVTLYSDPNGSNILWQSTMNTTLDSNGVFNVMLGTADNPLPAPAVMDRPIWLGVAVDNGPELRPLSEMTASAYALNVVDNAITTAKLVNGAVTAPKIAAGSVESANLADNAVTTTKIADSSITASKVNMNYVGAISVNGKKATGIGSGINIESAGDFRVYYDSATSTIQLGNPPKSFIGTQPGGVNANTDDGTFGPSDPLSTNAVVGGERNEAWWKWSGVTPELTGHDFVGGGFANKAWGLSSAVVGGDTNVVTSDTSFIGGGYGNRVRSQYAALAGGNRNFIDTEADASFLGGGIANEIGSYGFPQDVGDTSYIGGAVLAGGMNDTVKSVWGSLVGGHLNKIDTFANAAFIGAGYENTILLHAASAAIAGGDSNQVMTAGSFIGAGAHNIIPNVLPPLGQLSDAGIVAGANNYDSAQYAVIAGGLSDSINGRNTWTAAGGESFIGGGYQNMVSAEGSFEGTGYHNTVITSSAGIVSGDSNTIESGSFNGFIGAGEDNRIDTGSKYASVVGGFGNLIDTNSEYTSITGGSENRVGTSSPDAAIVGGVDNNVISSSALIGGGDSNLISPNSTESIIGGGDSNIVEAMLDFIGGGYHGLIDTGSGFSSIASGNLNLIDTSSPYSIIGGGNYNTLLGPHDVIGGGNWNQLGAGGSIFRAGTQPVIGGFIGGGDSNACFSNDAVVAGGVGNTADYGFATTVAGGHYNAAHSPYSFVGGGSNNIAGSVPGGSGTQGEDTAAVVVGGTLNNAQEAYTAIVGGDSNQIWSPYGFIGGGYGNFISEPSNMNGAYFSIIGGGNDNTVDGNFATLGGGRGNDIDSWPAGYGTIAGGDSNTISNLNPPLNGIGGAFIGGGKYNNVNAEVSVVAGGFMNTAGGTFSSIGGGDFNNTGGPYSTIPGGDSLIANSFAQTVVGYNNLPSGTFVQGTQHAFGAGGITTQDLPLLVVGNGDNVSGVRTPSNAFEVSYDGHSTVYDVNGTSRSIGPPPLGRAEIYGATYPDNTIVAWANALNVPIPGPMVQFTPTADIGVAYIAHPYIGVFLVKLNVNQPDGTLAKALTDGSITVTVEDTTNYNDTTGTNCGYATASAINTGGAGANEFIVRTYTGMVGGCELQDKPFFLKVCAR